MATSKKEASQEEKAPAKKKRKVEFIKPVSGFAYFPGDKTELLLSDNDYAELKEGGFIK